MIKFKSCLWISCVGTAALFFTAVYAAPGQLANAPLFVGSATTTAGSGAGVPSNVFFQIDDSGSMDSTFATQKFWSTCRYLPSMTSGGGSCGTVQISDDTTIKKENGGTTDWRDNSYEMNVLQYNPNLTYVDWKKGDGTYYHGTLLGNAPVTTTTAPSITFEVWDDTHGYTGTMPSTTSGGSSISKKVGTVITTIKHSALNRTIGANGVMDYWDEHTTYTIPSSNTGSITKTKVTYTAGATAPAGSLSSAACPVASSSTYATVACANNNQLITVTIKDVPTLTANSTSTTLAAGTSPFGSRTLAQERQNIANWHEYYRTRFNVTKGAVGYVIDKYPKYRYGLNTIWNTTWVDVPASTVTDFVASNVILLDKLYKEKTDDRTPLPDALNRVGLYYKHAAVPVASTDTSGNVSSISSTTTSHPDPIVYECQQNFAIMQTDGYWNQDLASATQTLIGDYDGDGNGATKSTLGDVAMYYYKNNGGSISSTFIGDKVPVNAFDTNKKQHMVTYTVAFGLEGYLEDKDKDGWPDYDSVHNTNVDLTESGDNKLTSAIETGLWGKAVNGGGAENIDDLWHAAYNGRGLYVSAGAPDKIAEGFQHIFESINNAQPQTYAGSATAVSFNSSTLIPSVSAAYLAQFSKSEKGSWSGDVLSYSFDEKTKAVKQSPDWYASTVLDARVNASTKLITNPRNILTFNNTTGKSVPFLWNYLTTEQKNDLLKDATTTKAQARLNYLRGDRNNEGAGENFRVRDHLLGDIIHSDPLSVGKPSGFWPNRYPFPATFGETYNEFKLSQENRQRMVYAGANDGMLHAFSATDGSEMMAYIPNTVFSANTSEGLHYLTQTDYDHRYYVDMPSVVSDVFIDTGFGRSWHSLLISGEMAGGKGIFALDITDPSKFSETNAAKIALWEFDSSDDADMGYSFSLPSVAMMPNGKWAVIFGNGYNNNGKGQAALFIVFVEDGLDGSWVKDSDYIKIELPVAGDPTAAQVAAGINCNALTTCNGLSSVQTYSTRQNSVTDRVYAGDLKGNMWAFDVSSKNPADWGVAYGTVSAPKPLFTATHHIAATAGGVPAQQNISAPKPQPITTRPLIVKNARAVGNSPNVLVLFGTGQYLISGDVTTSDMQSFYGVLYHGFSRVTPENLIEQTFLTGPFYNEQGLDVTNKTRLLSSNTVKYAEAYNKTTSKCLDASKSLSNCAFAKDSAGKLISNQGWFVNFNKADKERLGADPDVTDDINLFFNTWIPGSETTTVATGNVDLCAPSEISTTASGTGYKMVMNLFTGTATDKPVIDTNSNGNIGTDDLIRTDQTMTSTTKNYVVAGEVFLKGLPASSSFFNNQQFVPGTSDSTIGGGLSDAVTAAQTAVDAAQAASDAATAAYDDAAALQAILQTIADEAATALKDASKYALEHPDDVAAQQAAKDAAKALEDAETAVAAAAEKTAAAKAKARRALVALKIANKKLGVASNQNIKELISKPAMARIGWQELRND